MWKVRWLLQRCKGGEVGHALAGLLAAWVHGCCCLGECSLYIVTEAATAAGKAACQGPPFFHMAIPCSDGHVWHRTSDGSTWDAWVDLLPDTKLSDTCVGGLGAASRSRTGSSDSAAAYLAQDGHLYLQIWSAGKGFPFFTQTHERA